MIKIILGLFSVLILAFQLNKSTSEEYSKLVGLEKFSVYKPGTRLKLQDNFNNLILIDTMLLEPFQLINNEPTEYKIDRLEDFQCKLLGIYRKPNFDIILLILTLQWQETAIQ